MPSQQLLLSWKDHYGALVTVFENLLEKNSLVDCTLAAEGQYLKAHKVVLSACSSYFELLFSQESEKNPIVILKDVEFQELEAAVNFMYRGEVEVQEDRLAAFLEVADALQIKGLGGDGKTRNPKEKSSVKSSSTKSATTPQQLPRKDTLRLSSHSGSASQSPNIPSDCEVVGNNESSSVRQTSRSESSYSSPSVPPSTSFSKSGQAAWISKDLKSNLATALPQFSSEKNEQSDINPVIKTEPETDIYVEETLEEADEDFGNDVTMLEDREVWDEQNIETLSDEHSSNQQEPGDNWTQQDGDQNFSPIVVKDEPSASTSWSNQEPYGGGENEPSAGTSGASTGTEYTVVPFGHNNQQSTRSSCSTLFYRPGNSSHSNIRISAVSSLQSQDPLEPEAPSHICTECRSVFSSSLQLEKHMRFHSENRIHKCPHCDFTVKKSSLLTAHLRTHTRESSFRCPYCVYRSHRFSDMEKHIRIHTGEKPYKCPDCNYQSTVSANLIRHRRTHSGLKPYK